VTTHVSTPAATASTNAWRSWNLVAITALNAYSAGIAWQAQLVSYPLFRAVAPQDFGAYHQQYSDSIPGAVILPGFVTFLATSAFYWTRPAEVSRAFAAVVSASGVVALLSTVLWAIPRHADLERAGQSDAAIDSLLRANAVRTAALTLGAMALTWCVGRLLSRGR
jgi:hypothetical protein